MPVATLDSNLMPACFLQYFNRFSDFHFRMKMLDEPEYEFANSRQEINGEVGGWREGMVIAAFLRKNSDFSFSATN